MAGSTDSQLAMVFTARCALVQSAVLRSHGVCLSVRLSVTLVDQDDVDWKSWKLIARTINPTLSLFVAQSPCTYSQRTWGNLGDTRGGVGKSAGAAQVATAHYTTTILQYTTAQH